VVFHLPPDLESRLIGGACFFDRVGNEPLFMLRRKRLGALHFAEDVELHRITPCWRAISQNGDWVDGRAGTFFDAERGHGQKEFPSFLGGTGVLELDERKIVEKVQPHRNESAHVHGDRPILDR
jgi:hypothetical protein